MARNYGWIGDALSQLGRPAEAREYYEAAANSRLAWVEREPENRDARRELAGAYGSLTWKNFSGGDFAAARRCARQAMDILQALADEQPADFGVRWNLALKTKTAAEIALLCEQNTHAVELYGKAIRQLATLLDEDKANARLKASLAEAYYGLATARQNTAAATELYEKSLDLCKELVKISPNSVVYQQSLMMSMARCGQLEQAAEVAATLQAKAKSSFEFYRIAGGYAQCAAAADASSDTGSAAKSSQYLSLALEALQAAVDLGFADTVLMKCDPDLAPLHDERDFQQLVAKLSHQASIVIAIR